MPAAQMCDASVPRMLRNWWPVPRVNTSVHACPSQRSIQPWLLTTQRGPPGAAHASSAPVSLGMFVPQDRPSQCQQMSESHANTSVGLAAYSALISPPATWYRVRSVPTSCQTVPSPRPNQTSERLEPEIVVTLTPKSEASCQVAPFHQITVPHES